MSPLHEWLLKFFFVGGIACFFAFVWMALSIDRSEKEVVTVSSIIPESRCPKCGYPMNRADDPQHKRAREPEPGDLSICMKCGELLMFRNDLCLVSCPDDFVLSPETILEVRRIRTALTAIGRGVARQ